MTPNHTKKGFTLVEVMITIVILGIISVIALPSYSEQVKKTRRTNAQSDLVELTAYMERYYGENFTYEAATLPFTESPKEGSTKYYDLAINASNETNFTLSATPKGSQANDRCGNMTVNDTGTHTAQDNNCW